VKNLAPYAPGRIEERVKYLYTQAHQTPNMMEPYKITTFPDFQCASEILDREINAAVTTDNEPFVRRYGKLIPEVFERFRIGSRNRSTPEIAKLYAQLVRELANCAEQYGSYVDSDVAAVCIRLRLQRCFLSAVRRPRPVRQIIKVA